MDINQSTPESHHYPPVHSFNNAQRVLTGFKNEKAFVGTFRGEPMLCFSTQTINPDYTALNLLTHALRVLSPSAKLSLDDEQVASIMLPLDPALVNALKANVKPPLPEFPMHQLQRALQVVRDDLLFAMTRNADGGATLDAAKLKTLSPEQGMDILGQLMTRHAKCSNDHMEVVVTDADHDLPQNIRYLVPAGDPKRPFEGHLETRVPHREYTATMEHQAGANLQAITEQLPERSGMRFEFNKQAYAGIVQELGAMGRDRQLN